MEDKGKIRAVYGELIGYLEQASDKGYTTTRSMWENFNQSIQELNTVTSSDYSKFSISPTDSSTGPYINIEEYRNKLGGLIMRLHAEYFSDQPVPIGGAGPSTVIHQSQSQAQSVHIALLLEVQSYIDQRLNDKDIGKQEKTFLQKVKESLHTAKSTVELIRLILSVASSLGLDMQAVIKALSK